jgi:hypothetical protein
MLRTDAPHATTAAASRWQRAVQRTSTFAQEVDEGRTEGMLRNRSCKRLLSNRFAYSKFTAGFSIFFGWKNRKNRKQKMEIQQ